MRQGRPSPARGGPEIDQARAPVPPPGPPAPPPPGRRHRRRARAAGPQPRDPLCPEGSAEAGGLRYCINSAALRFIPLDDLEREGYGDYRKLFEDTGRTS